MLNNLFEIVLLILSLENYLSCLYFVIPYKQSSLIYYSFNESSIKPVFNKFVIMLYVYLSNLAYCSLYVNYIILLSTNSLIIVDLS